jgi:hypothetical protein
MRFACGTRVGSPAAVKSPRTGSAMIWAACLPVAHPGVPEPLPVAAAGDVRLRNQSDVAAMAGPVSRELLTTGSGTTTSRRWFADWTSTTGRMGTPRPPVMPRSWKPA